MSIILSTENHALVIFPRDMMEKSSKYLLDTYYGSNTIQIGNVKKLPSRSVSIYRSYPTLIISDKKNISSTEQVFNWLSKRGENRSFHQNRFQITLDLRFSPLFDIQGSWRWLFLGFKAVLATSGKFCGVRVLYSLIAEQPPFFFLTTVDIGVLMVISVVFRVVLRYGSFKGCSRARACVRASIGAFLIAFGFNGKMLGTLL